MARNGTRGIPLVRFRLAGATAAAVLAITAAAANGGAAYVGAGKCKPCHLKQFEVWSASTHSKAFEVLPADKRATAECISCHVTGHGGPVEGTESMEAVQCEACHGPGSLYRKVTIMSKPKYKADPEGQRKLAIQAGLVLPDESTCRSCHNEKSPTFKGFDYAAMKEKIKHWDLE